MSVFAHKLINFMLGYQKIKIWCYNNTWWSNHSHKIKCILEALIHYVLDCLDIACLCSDKNKMGKTIITISPSTMETLQENNLFYQRYFVVTRVRGFWFVSVWERCASEKTPETLNRSVMVEYCRHFCWRKLAFFKGTWFVVQFFYSGNSSST